MTSAEIQFIIDFVEGRLGTKEFEQCLYKNPNFEAVLDNDPNLPRNTYVGESAYLYVIQENFNSPAGVLNVHGALSQFLERNGFSFQPTKHYEEFHDVLLSAQPRWLDVVEYIQDEILPAAGNLPLPEIKEWLQLRLLELFRYVDQPPQWVQNPHWPIGENGPLVFLGQIQVNDYFHDEAAAYVFHDPTSGFCETVIQVH